MRTENYILCGRIAQSGSTFTASARTEKSAFAKVEDWQKEGEIVGPYRIYRERDGEILLNGYL